MFFYCRFNLDVVVSDEVVSCKLHVAICVSNRHFQFRTVINSGRISHPHCLCLRKTALHNVDPFNGPIPRPMTSLSLSRVTLYKNNLAFAERQGSLTQSEVGAPGNVFVVSKYFTTTYVASRHLAARMDRF